MIVRRALMESSSYYFSAKDGQQLYIRKWLPPKGTQITNVIQIVHGMAEHSGRYERFAKVLTKSGFAVFAHDQRGHGKTAKSLQKIGWIAEKQGWELLAQDIRELSIHIQNEFADTPLMVLGHSMGSFLVRDCMADPSWKIRGVILSGTGGDPGVLGSLGKVIASVEGFFRGNKCPSPLMTFLTFGGFNLGFRPTKTYFDWLSRDNAEVKKYINDSFCGGIFSCGFFQDLIGGLQKIHTSKHISSTHENLPILFISGDKDPVGKNGKDVKRISSLYMDSGVTDITVKLYPQGRHEMLNEVNHMEVAKDVLSWIQTH